MIGTQPGSGPETSLSGERILSAFTTGARLLIAALGGLYTVGLLIVNFDLARYGVSNLALARPEYVMAGAFWAAIMAPSGVVGGGCFLLARERWRRRELGYALSWSVLGVMFGILIPVLLLSMVSVAQEGALGVPTSEILSRHVIAVFCNVTVVLGLLIFVFTTGSRTFFEHEEWRFRVTGAGLLAVTTVPALTVPSVPTIVRH